MIASSCNHRQIVEADASLTPRSTRGRALNPRDAREPHSWVRGSSHGRNHSDLRPRLVIRVLAVVHWAQDQSRTRPEAGVLRSRTSGVLDYVRCSREPRARASRAVVRRALSCETLRPPASEPLAKRSPAPGGRFFCEPTSSAWSPSAGTSSLGSLLPLRPSRTLASLRRATQSRAGHGAAVTNTDRDRLTGPGTSSTGPYA